MTRFVAMRILANHTGTENRQLALVGRFIREHTVQTFGKAGFSSGQFNQAIDIMGYRPIVLPSITLKFPFESRGCMNEVSGLNTFL